MRHHNLQVTGSVSVNGISAATAADLATYTGSNDSKVSTLQSFTASVSGTNSFTASASNRLNSIEIITASNVARLNALETHSASVDTTNITQNSRLSALETTSASVDSLNTTQNTRLTNLENKTGSLATTGSNTFIGTQVITGSLYVTTDLIVQGSSSIQNITGSSINIGTNKIILNTANPAVRYAGISVIDSGSTGLTGSILWDSTNNNWLYQNPSGSSYTSAKFIAGPQSAALGSEPGLVTNYIMKAIADDHISSSAIYDDGTIVAIKNTTHITGSLNVGATSYPSINLYTTNGTNFAITNRYTDNRLSIDKIGTGELVNILGSGAVGIGVTNPQRKVDIVATGEQLRLSYDGSTTYTDFRNDSAGGLLVNTSAGYIIHYIAGSEKMRIKADGTVGIGTNNAGDKLDVNGNIRSSGTSTILRLDNTAGTPQSWWVGQDITGTYDGRFYIYNTTSSTHALTINKSNRVGIGIGTSDAYSTLSLKGASISWGETMTIYPASNGYTTIALRLEGSDTTTGTWAIGKQSKSSESYTTEYLQFVKNSLTGGTLHRADAVQTFDPANGNALFGFKVGIGTTNPAEALQVVGNLRGSNRLYLNNGTNTLELGPNYIQGYLNSGAANTDMLFYTGTTERMRIYGAGQVTRPYQPAFLSCSTSSGFTVTGGSWYNISNALTEEQYDIGSNYSTSTAGRFVAPVAGKYMFYAGGWSSISSNGERYAFCATINGGGYNFIGGGNYCITDSPLSGYSVMYNLAAGDYVELFAFSAVTGTWGAGTHRVYFGGYLL